MKGKMVGTLVILTGCMLALQGCEGLELDICNLVCGIISDILGVDCTSICGTTP